MRITTLLAIPFLGVITVLPSQAPAQVNVTVAFGARLGPEVGVFAYSQDRNGDWRKNYRQWTPVTLYDVNGHYYRTSVHGARAVTVYSHNNEYFLPPTDHAWVGFDKRYNYHQQPNDGDMGRVSPYTPHVVVDARFGAEIGVTGYSAERAGDWHTSYRNWTPTTVYEFNGHYYPHNVNGARAVSIYRYHDEYFLPPDDHAFMGFDKRFDYNHPPNSDDRGRVRTFGRGRE